MNFFKSINMNSGQAIYKFARAISTHAALPLGGLFIARPSFLFLDLHGWERGRGLSPAPHAKAWARKEDGGAAIFKKYIAINIKKNVLHKQEIC